METASTIVCEAGDKLLKKDGVFAGNDFFKMFSYPFLHGTPRPIFEVAYPGLLFLEEWQKIFLEVP